MEKINILLAFYALVLFGFLIYGIVELRRVKKSGDDRQIAIFYRASFDGLIGGILGYLITVFFNLLVRNFGLSGKSFSWLPSPIFIAVVTMYISYKIRIRE